MGIGDVLHIKVSMYLLMYNWRITQETSGEQGSRCLEKMVGYLINRSVAVNSKSFKNWCCNHSSIVGSKPLLQLCGQNSNVASAIRAVWA